MGCHPKILGGSGTLGHHTVRARIAWAVKSLPLRSNGSLPQPRQNVGQPESRFCRLINHSHAPIAAWAVHLTAESALADSACRDHTYTWVQHGFTVATLLAVVVTTVQAASCRDPAGRAVEAGGGASAVEVRGERTDGRVPEHVHQVQPPALLCGQTRVAVRGGKPTGGTQFLDEMKLKPRAPAHAPRLSVVVEEEAPAPL